MPKEEVEEFARLLIAHVRDMAIGACDGLLKANARGVLAKRWRRTIKRAKSADAAVADVIPDCVDQTLFCLLDAIDQGLIRLSFTASTGVTIELTSEGLSELGGWYMGSDGWRAAYSQERFVDDFKDLT